MFIPIITKPVYVRVILKDDGSFELQVMGSTGKPITVCSRQFLHLFPGSSTTYKFGIRKMEKAFAEKFFEENKQ